MQNPLVKLLALLPTSWLVAIARKRRPSVEPSEQRTFANPLAAEAYARFIANKNVHHGRAFVDSLGELHSLPTDCLCVMCATRRPLVESSDEVTDDPTEARPSVESSVLRNKLFSPLVESLAKRECAVCRGVWGELVDFGSGALMHVQCAKPNDSAKGRTVADEYQARHDALDIRPTEQLRGAVELFDSELVCAYCGKRGALTRMPNGVVLHIDASYCA